VNRLDPTGLISIGEIFDKAVKNVKRTGGESVGYVKSLMPAAKAVGKAAMPGCYIYNALKEKEDDSGDELRDLNKCSNPVAGW
jgi:hypothetical protein